MTEVIFPLVLAVGAAVAYAAAASLQRRQIAFSASSRTWRSLLGVLVRRPRWWAGVAAMAVGAALHVAALGLGAVTLVQPIGALALVFALPLDARLSHRRVTRCEWGGAGLLVAGLTSFLLVAPSNDQAPVPAPGPLLLVVAVAGGVVVAVVVVTLRAPAMRRAVARAAAGGVCMGTTSASVHVAIDASTSPHHQLAVVAVSASSAAVLPVVGLSLLQLAYRDGGLGGPLATLTILDPVVAAAIGVVLLQERTTHGLVGIVVAVAGSVGALAGLCALIRFNPSPPETSVAAHPSR